MNQVHLLISGFVQGVGFRVFVRNHARKLNIKGYVQNLPDHRVEVIAQTDEKTLKEFVDICSKGPFLAEVKNISVDWQEPTKIFESFEIIR